MKDLENEMIPVPLPTEVPPPPQLDKIPLEILHSATVEMLIQQNEDLSSRLRVNIRRNSQLEQKIIENEKEMLDLNRRRENVLAQIEIIKEKESLWSSQKQAKERQLESLQQEGDLLELRYNELSATSKQKERELRETLAEKNQVIEKLERKLMIFSKVRVRAKEKLRSLLLDMAFGLQKNQKNIRKTESSHRILQRNYENLKTEILEKESFFKEQLAQLKEASTKGLMVMDEKLTNLKAKNQSLKEQKNQLDAEIKELKLCLHEERRNRYKLAETNKELSELRNEIIRLRRDARFEVDALDKARADERADLEKARADLMQSIKERELEKQKLSDCENKILDLTRDNKEISDQLQSIQGLWMEAQSKLEKEELRAQALEKINRQLSQQSKHEKLERATQNSHPEAKNMEPTATVSPVKTQEDAELQDKIKSVFATQYRTFTKSPDMDL